MTSRAVFKYASVGSVSDKVVGPKPKQAGVSRSIGIAPHPSCTSSETPSGGLGHH